MTSVSVFATELREDAKDRLQLFFIGAILVGAIAWTVRAGIGTARGWGTWLVTVLAQELSLYGCLWAGSLAAWLIGTVLLSAGGRVSQPSRIEVSDIASVIFWLVTAYPDFERAVELTIILTPAPAAPGPSL